MAPKIEWETFEGITYAYLDDGREISISARTRHNRWGESDSNVREWYITDEDNKRIASGKADGLRAAKAAAIAALNANRQGGSVEKVDG
jgi:hypothetical protein